MAARSDSPASRMALGGVLAALATVLLSLGTLIPVATYTCPMLCMLLLQLVLKTCGSRTGWAWFGAVAILGILLAPDKEAAGVFAAVGYYPMVKVKLDGKKLGPLWKLLWFNSSILALYWLLLHLFGMAALAEEFRELGKLLTLVLLAMGNGIFCLLDRVLSKKWRKGG